MRNRRDTSKESHAPLDRRRVAPIPPEPARPTRRARVGESAHGYVEQSGEIISTFTPSAPVSWGVPPQDWHEQVEEPLLRRYLTQGWSTHLFVNDWALLRRACGPRHPAEVGLRELEEVVLRATAAGTRANYVARLRSIFNSLRIVGAIPPDHRPEENLPKLRRPRSTPRPISPEQAHRLMTEADAPFRDWFVLGCLAGLRAVEVSRLQGAWLEHHPDGAALRIHGKGNTDLTIPAHPMVVAVIESHRTLGRLWLLNPNKVSAYATKEMRRLDVPATFHACRHYFATQLLAASGGDLIVVSELMRHASLNTTRGYAQLQQGRKRLVLDQLEVRQEGVGHVLAL